MYWKLCKVLKVALAKLCSNSVLVNLNNNKNNNKNNNNNNNNNNNKKKKKKKKKKKNIFIAPIQQ